MSLHPSSSGRWAPLTSPHRECPSVASHRSGSSRSRKSRNWRTRHVGDSRSAYWTRSRPTSPDAVHASFSQRSVRCSSCSPSQVVQWTSWPSAGKAATRSSVHSSGHARSKLAPYAARYRAPGDRPGGRPADRAGGLPARWRRSRGPRRCRSGGCWPRTWWRARTSRRSPTRPSTGTPCGPPSVPRRRSSWPSWASSPPARAPFARAIGPGEAVRIMTGAPLPDGCRRRGHGRGQRARRRRPGAALPRSCRRDRGARPRATTCAPATCCSSPGPSSARPWPACWPASTCAGRSWCPAARVAVLSTGDELVTDGSPLRPGQIRESNSTMLAPLLAEAGCVVDRRGVVADDEAALEAVLRDAASTCDAIVTSGGVSMGDYDVVKAVLGRIADMRWMQVAIKPAKPFAFGTLDGVPVFGLPGNPVSSLVSFELLARPALRRMMGHGHVARPQPGGGHRRRAAPPRRREGALRAGHRRRSPTTAATTCARSAPRAATSWRPRRSPTPSSCCPTGPACPPAPTSPSSCSPAEHPPTVLGPDRGRTCDRSGRRPIDGGRSATPAGVP